MYEFWHDYIKPKYGEIARLCYLDTYIHTYIYIDIYIYIQIDIQIYIYIDIQIDRQIDRQIYYTCIKTDDIYKDIVEVVETRFDTSNYELDSPLPKGKNKILMGLMKDELGGKIIVEFVGLTPKTYSYLINEG